MSSLTLSSTSVSEFATASKITKFLTLVKRMGCCTSTTSKPAAEKNPQLHEQTGVPEPNPLPEEESVKEVLSETPTVPKKPPIPSTYLHERFEPRKIKHPFPRNPTTLDERRQKDRIAEKSALIFHPEDLSEEASSEVCSTKSECLVATAKKDDENVAEILHNSPAKLLERSLSGDIGKARKPPVKKSNQSPNRSGSGKDVRGFGSCAQKKDSGESSERPSVSPGNRSGGGGGKTDVGGSASGGRSGKSPRRVKSEVGEKIRKLDSLSLSNRENKRPPTSNELLENPFVSLECFIFL